MHKMCLFNHPEAVATLIDCGARTEMQDNVHALVDN